MTDNNFQRKQYIQTLIINAQREIYKDTKKFRKFLQFIPKVIDFTYEEQLQLFMYNEDETYFATETEWNSLGRIVTPNEPAYQVYNFEMNAFQSIYGLSQTQGKAFVRDTIDIDIKGNEKSLNETIMKQAPDNEHHTLLGHIGQWFVKASTKEKAETIDVKRPTLTKGDVEVIAFGELLSKVFTAVKNKIRSIFYREKGEEHAKQYTENSVDFTRAVRDDVTAGTGTQREENSSNDRRVRSGRSEQTVGDTPVSTQSRGLGDFGNGEIAGTDGFMDVASSGLSHRGETRIVSENVDKRRAESISRIEEQTGRGAFSDFERAGDGLASESGNRSIGDFTNSKTIYSIKLNDEVVFSDTHLSASLEHYLDTYLDKKEPYTLSSVTQDKETVILKQGRLVQEQGLSDEEKELYHEHMTKQLTDFNLEVGSTVTFSEGTFFVDSIDISRNTLYLANNKTGMYMVKSYTLTQVYQAVKDFEQVKTIINDIKESRKEKTTNVVFEQEPVQEVVDRESEPAIDSNVDEVALSDEKTTNVVFEQEPVQEVVDRERETGIDSNVEEVALTEEKTTNVVFEQDAVQEVVDRESEPNIDSTVDEVALTEEKTTNVVFEDESLVFKFTNEDVKNYFSSPLVTSLNVRVDEKDYNSTILKEYFKDFKFADGKTLDNFNPFEEDEDVSDLIRLNFFKNRDGEYRVFYYNSNSLMYHSVLNTFIEQLEKDIEKASLSAEKTTNVVFEQETVQEVVDRESEPAIDSNVDEVALSDEKTTNVVFDDEKAVDKVVAVGVGQSFAIVSEQEIDNIPVHDTGIDVLVDNVQYPLLKGDTYENSRQIDEILDKQDIEYAITDYQVINDKNAEQLSLFSDELFTTVAMQEDEPEIQVVDENNQVVVYDPPVLENQNLKIVYSSGKKAKFQDNIQAIKLLKTLQSENRLATEEEKTVLAKYSGWGGVAEAFDKYNSSWKKEYELLKALLTDTEYHEVKSSVLTAYYTNQDIIQSIYTALSNIPNFKPTQILEMKLHEIIQLNIEKPLKYSFC